MTNVTLQRSKRRRVWMLRWYGTDGRRYCETIGDARRMSKRDADRVRDEKQSSFRRNVVHPNKPARVTLDHFSQEYRERRRQGDRGRGFLRGAPRLSEATITDHAMTLRYMIEHFGGDRVLGSIDVPGADGFVTALAAGKLASARKKSRQTYGMSEQTVRGHIRNAKAVFNWARRMNIVTTNPFGDFDGTPPASKANHYVPMADFEKLVEAAPTHGWKAMYALCRLAGLRRGESLELPWAGRAASTDGEEHWVGVDWERRRLHVLGNSKVKRVYRQVPMSPRLHDILLEAFDKADDGAVTVTGLSPNNLTKLAQDHLGAADLTPWPKIYQSMRSSCENDWKQKHVAEATYTAWAGHSATVSRKSYVAPTEAEFEVVSGRA